MVKSLCLYLIVRFGFRGLLFRSLGLGLNRFGAGLLLFASADVFFASLFENETKGAKLSFDVAIADFFKKILSLFEADF
jgi:hypothetical protein